MKKLKQRSIEEKKTLLTEHFLYELDMIESMIKYRLDLLNSNIDNQFAENIIVEILTIHARNLFEFFYKDKTWEDYATAFQFMKKDIDWIDIRPPITESFKILESRVHVEVAHLTYKRIVGKPPMKMWHFKPLYDDLRKVTCMFLENVAEEHFNDKLMDFKERFCIQ